MPAYNGRWKRKSRDKARGGGELGAKPLKLKW